MVELRLSVVVAFGLCALIFLEGCGESEQAPNPDPSATVAEDTRPRTPAFDIRSVTLDARRRPDPNLLVHLRDLGVTHITLVSFGWQEATDDPHVRIDTSDGWYSESHRGIRTLARQADTLGMDVILKPHLWIGGYDEDQNRSEIGFEHASNWETWEENYRDFLLHYARLASDVDADLLVLGTELTSAATTRPFFWRQLADTVQTVYDGDLTYAANWHNEYQQIDFWDALDYVGVQAYFPLADSATSSVEALQARWQSHRETLATVHRRTGKPILFTEIGYRSAPSAAKTPWRWPERDADTVPPDSTMQARCYRAFFTTMGHTPWFAGAIIWKWHPKSSDEHPTAFTPQGKPAEAVLRRWFTAEPTPPSPADKAR